MIHRQETGRPSVAQKPSFSKQVSKQASKQARRFACLMTRFGEYMSAVRSRAMEGMGQQITSASRN